MLTKTFLLKQDNQKCALRLSSTECKRGNCNALSLLNIILLLVFPVGICAGTPCVVVIPIYFGVRAVSCTRPRLIIPYTFLNVDCIIVQDVFVFDKPSMLSALLRLPQSISCTYARPSSVDSFFEIGVS